MALRERERYGDRLEAELSRYGFVAIAPPGCWEHIAAAVIAARDADLAATVRQWRDEAEQRRTFYRDHAEDGDFRDFLIREQALYDAFASVLQLLEGGDDGNG